MHLFFILACSPAAIKLGDTASNAGSDSADTDTDTDTDSDTDTDTDSDADSDPAGDYSGDVTGHVEPSSNQGPPAADCSGTCSFTIDASGNLTGEASCMIDNNFGFEGPLSGSVNGENADGDWTIAFGPQSFPYAFSGTISNGQATFSVNEDMGGMGTFTATLSAQR